MRPKHKPDSPGRAEERKALGALHKALMPLHRALINATKEEYSVENGPVDNPYKLLGLVQSDPFFEWLKPVTELIVQVDDLTENDFETSDVKRVVERVRVMFLGAEDGDAFNQRYQAVLQQDFDVATFHPTLRRVVEALAPDK